MNTPAARAVTGAAIGAAHSSATKRVRRIRFMVCTLRFVFQRRAAVFYSHYRLDTPRFHRPQLHVRLNPVQKVAPGICLEKEQLQPIPLELFLDRRLSKRLWRAAIVDLHKSYAGAVI
jgi:hypothetical protein